MSARAKGTLISCPSSNSANICGSKNKEYALTFNDSGKPPDTTLTKRELRRTRRTMGANQPKYEEPTRGKESRMARKKKRPYGSGCLIKTGKGWVLRWREMEFAPDGTKKKVLRFKTLGAVSNR